MVAWWVGYDMSCGQVGATGHDTLKIDGWSTMEISHLLPLKKSLENDDDGRGKKENQVDWMMWKVPETDWLSSLVQFLN